MTKRARFKSLRDIRLSRDLVLFVGGLAGVFHETVFSKADRPLLLGLFAAMMGLPAFLRTDESRKPPPKSDPRQDDEEKSEKSR